MFEETRRYVKTLGLPEGDLNDLPTSAARFPDGAAYRIEVPTVNLPAELVQAKWQEGFPLFPVFFAKVICDCAVTACITGIFQYFKDFCACMFLLAVSCFIFLNDLLDHWQIWSEYRMILIFG